MSTLGSGRPDVISRGEALGRPTRGSGPGASVSLDGIDSVTLLLI